VDPLTAREFRNLSVRGRLNPGVTLSEAQAEVTTLGRSLELAYPLTNTNKQPILQTELEVRFERRPLDSGLMVVLGTLSMAVLCVACANVAGLLASRAPARAREIALRLAVGAGRGRVVRQLVTESLAIALAGGVAGLGVAYVGVALLRQIQFPTEVVSLPVLQIDRRALVFSLIVAMASALLFGLGPAIQTTKVNLVATLKASDADNQRRRYRPTGRNVLAALQVALSLVLLTIAAWAYNVFNTAFDDGPGFRVARMAKVTIDPSQAQYGDGEITQFFDTILDRARRLPGARSAAVTSAMPLFSFETRPIAPEGYQFPEGQSSVSTFTNSVDEGYFETMEIPILKGRGLQTSDTADSRRVAVVNEKFAGHYWPDRDALGARFRIVHDPNADLRESRWIEIVGIARTSMYGYFAEAPQDMIYLPFRQQPSGNMVLLVQTSGESSALVPPLRQIAHDVDPAVPAYDAQTIETFYAARVTTIGTVVVRLIGGMGLMGMTLTMVGLYGLVSYAVSRRTREIGIRVAVGASYRRVVGLVLRQGTIPTGFGLAAGLCLSAITTRLLHMVIPVSQPYDSRTLIVVLPLVLATSVLASYVPARRAARVDPTIALRCE
jgi:putative ABC transport system permease protein